MTGVRVRVTRYVDDAQPGWVEATLRDAWGREWVFVDKAPVFTESTPGAGSRFPLPGVLRCEVVGSWPDESGRAVCTIDTARPDAVEAEGGVSRFDVLAGQLVPL